MTTIDKLKNTLFMRVFAFMKIPLISYLKPVVEVMDDERCVIRFPLSRRARNHLGAMYFGALCVGADCAGGAIAMKLIYERGEPIAFVFKDFHAEFLKRAEGDVIFTCTEGPMLRELVERALTSGQREEGTVHVAATVPDKLGDEPVGRFALTISLKKKA